MTNRLIATLIAAALAGGIVATAMPCEQEDSRLCTWYADRQGNGQGESFTDLGIALVRW